MKRYIGARLSDDVFQENPLYGYITRKAGRDYYRGDLVEGEDARILGIATKDAKAGEILPIQVQGPANVAVDPKYAEQARNMGLAVEEIKRQLAIDLFNSLGSLPKQAPASITVAQATSPTPLTYERSISCSA